MKKEARAVLSVCWSIALAVALALPSAGNARGDEDRDRGKHKDKADPCADFRGHRGKVKKLEKTCREAGGASGIAKADYNGDGFADLAIGVPGEDTPANRPDSGAVIVVYGSANGLTTDSSVHAPQFWSQNAEGVPQLSESGDRFGSSVVGGDFNDDGFSDLAIGTPFEALAKNGEPNEGSVTVIYGSPIGLTTDPNSRVLEAQLWAITDLDNFSTEVCIEKLAVKSDADVPLPTAASFGSSLAWGDFDRDGIGDLAIGSPREEIEVDPFSPLRCRREVGAVGVIFGSRNEGLIARGSQVFTQNTTGMRNESESGDLFGSALSAGDFNGDQASDLAIGIFNEDVRDAQNVEIVDVGAVAVLFGAPDFGLTTDADEFIVATDLFRAAGDTANVGKARDRFGSSLAAGDFDGDGLDELAIGAHNRDAFGLADSGQVFVRNFGPGATQIWDQPNLFGLPLLDPLVGSLPEAGDNFGWALAAGDFDADGRKDLAIGVPFEDIPLSTLPAATIIDAGEVDVLYGSASGLSRTGRAPQQFHQNSGLEDQAEPGDQFGKSLTAWNFGRNEQGSRRVCVNNVCFEIPVTIATADLAVGVPGEGFDARVGAGAVNVIYGCFNCSPNGLSSLNNRRWTQSLTGQGVSEANDNFGAALY